MILWITGGRLKATDPIHQQKTRRHFRVSGTNFLASGSGFDRVEIEHAVVVTDGPGNPSVTHEANRLTNGEVAQDASESDR